MKNYIPLFRSMSHANSTRKITDRTKDDNIEASEFTNEKFLNRKGGLHNIPSEYDDIQPAMSGKREVKPEKGMRKFKGSDTIRKPKGDPDEVIHALKSLRRITKAYDSEFESNDEFELFDDYEN